MDESVARIEKEYITNSERSEKSKSDKRSKGIIKC
jgi:hypothetical protein